jgi:hypothetical protein
MAATLNLTSRHPDAVEGMGLRFKWAELQAEPSGVSL